MLDRRNIRILQEINDEALQYQRADLIFLPLTNAWANNALLEGMSCGRPVAVTDLPAIREYAGDAAVFVRKGSVESAVQALMQLKNDSHSRVVLGHAARTRMAARFSWKSIAEQHLLMYERILLVKS